MLRIYQLQLKESVMPYCDTKTYTAEKSLPHTFSPLSSLCRCVCSGDSLSSLRPRGRVFIHRDSLLLRRIPPAEPHSGRDRSVQFCLWVHVKTISKTYLDSCAGERSCVRTRGSLTKTSVHRIRNYPSSHLLRAAERLK